MRRKSAIKRAALVIVTPTGRRPVGGAFAPVAAVLSSHEGCRSGVCRSRMTCQGPGREGREITSGRRDARGLTFSVVIPARALQPGVSTGRKLNWRIALCGYGMTLALRIAFTCCVSHRWRTSAVCTGSGTPWPDSLGGRDLGWLPGLPSSSRYAPFQVAVACWSACSRTTSNPVSAMLSGRTIPFLQPVDPTV
jgi:hypothetical protein